MSYELHHSETLGENLRRICRKQIDLAVAIAKGKKEPSDTSVHETRKHIKKTRAALRLVRKEIGRGLFRQEDHCLRDIARLISEIRDAEVRLQTVRQLQDLTERRGHASYRQLEIMLALELENFMAAFAEWQVQAVPMLEKACAAIDCWPLDHFSTKQLCRAVQASYKRGRNSLARAKANASPANYHRFRKHAKVLWYQLRILRPINRVVLKNLSDDLGSLGALLGRAHDLSFLRERLSNEHGKAEWQREGHKLLAVIEISEGDLQRGATELAERFFAERPRDFGARIASWLNDWIKASAPSLAGKLV
jgi:CHAD domain-containing protein